MDILHLINQTPVDWISWKQSNVETATYGSEFVAAHIATEQVIDFCYKLRSMGVPTEKYTWLLEDNNYSSLSNYHQGLAYHFFRSAVAAGFLKFCYIDGKWNQALPITWSWFSKKDWVLHDGVKHLRTGSWEPHCGYQFLLLVKLCELIALNSQKPGLGGFRVMQNNWNLPQHDQDGICLVLLGWLRLSI